ncbi:MAG TPA: YARHG domain-containing protein [Chitinophagaceae bacterium]|nr:YARHG domain-containing protein [Chitinophagaceae bacterium]
MQYKNNGSFHLPAALMLLAVFTLSSCKDKKSGSAETENEAIEKPTDTPGANNQPDYRLGSFVGAFGENKITLLISSIKADSVQGRSIVAGNDRPFAGTIKKENTLWKIHAAEPGDHKDDGVFDLVMDPAKADAVMGTFTANDAKRPAKTFALDRKKFSYDPAVGNYPTASQRLLTAEDVENEMKEDLEFMRNEIFARHGFCFNKKHLRQQFELQDWYVPNTVDIKGFLTEIEKKNIALIKRYEKYAEEYGDEYGR